MLAANSRSVDFVVTARFLRLRYGRQSQALRPLLCQFSVGCCLYCKRLFQGWVACLACHSLKLKRVLQIFPDHLHDTTPETNDRRSDYEATARRINGWG